MEAQSAPIIDTQVDVHRQMFMSAQVIYDAAALLAVNHVSVKTSGVTGCEITNPCDRLPPERVEVCVVLDGEWNCGPVLRKHNSTPTPNIEKRQGEELAAPHFIHDALAHGCVMVFAAESEAFLNARMQEVEFITERLFINRSHAV